MLNSENSLAKRFVNYLVAISSICLVIFVTFISFGPTSSYFVKILAIDIHLGVFIFLVVIIIAIYSFSLAWIYRSREKTRMALQSKSLELENFFTNSIDLLCIADTEGHFYRLNPEWKRVLGYEISELEGKPFIDYVHPEDVALTIHATQALAKNSIIQDFFNRYRHKDGSYRWIEWRSYPEGGMIYASARDVTERKHAEQKLQENIERAQAFSDASNEGIIISDNGIVVEANKQFLKIHGFNEYSEIIGKSILEEFTPPEALATVKQHIVSNSDESYETISYRKNKSVFPVEIRGHAITLRGRNMRITTIRDLTEQKRTEQEMRETDLWLRDSQRNSHIGSYNFFIPTGVWKSSEEMDVIFGIPHNYDKSIDGWIKLIHPEHQLEMTDHLLNHVIAQRNQFNKDYRIVRQSDGEVRWVHGLGNLTFDDKSNPMQMIGTIQDITEQRNSQAEIIINEQRFRSIFENSSLGIALIGFDAKYLMVNNALCQILGYTPEEMLNMTFYDVTHPDDRDISRNALDYILTEDSIRYAKRYIHKDGRVVWAETSSRLIHGNSNEPLYFVSHVNDITEKKIAEDIKRENEEKFRIAFDNSPTGMSMIRPDGSYIAVNEILCQMFGYSSEELLAGGIANITHYEDVERSFQWIQKMIAGDNSEPEFEKRFIHKDGHVVWGLLRSQWIRNVDGSPRLSITHILDITQRKKAEEALKESEAKARLFVENVPMPVAMFDTEMRYIMASKRWSIDYKLGDQEIIGRSHYEVFPEIGDVWKDDHKRVLAGEIYKNEADRFERQDGSLQWLRYELFPWRKGDDTIGGIIMFTEDITERRQAEEAIRESEKKYRLLFENMTSGFALHQIVEDENGIPVDLQFLEVNSVFERSYGVKSDDIKGKRLRETFSNMPDNFINEIHKVLNGEIDHFVSYVEEFDRYIDFVWFKPNRNTIATIFNDITTNVKADNELKASEEKFSTAFRTSPDAVNINRLSDGVYIEINDGFSAGMGYTAEETIGKTSADLNIWVYPEETQRLRDGLKENGKVSNLESHLRKKNGEIVIGLMSATVITIRGERCVLSITRDITERKKAEDLVKSLNEYLETKVLERTEQLSQANKDLESFAYSVSHDLRAPLRHIDGFVRLMYSNIEQPKGNVTDYFEKIHAATGRMSVMIDDLLTFSRLGRKEFITSTVDLNFLVNEIIEQLKPDVSDRNISWIIHRLPQLPGDKSLLKMAFENLLSNAIKYTSRKPVATIEVGSSELQNNLVEIYIKDNGVGFDMAYVNKMFGVFQRLHSSEEFEGTGIGLANVKQIVSKHNGSIRAEGKVNEGAIFYITLPK